MHLPALPALKPLVAGAEREEPIGTHLHVFIGGLESLIVERIATRILVATCPDHRLMRVGEATAAKIRHRVGLPPDDVVENPKAEILQGAPDAENIVIRADHPE